ncbi:hypothetical protein M0802_004189 [Mischocyttarus mexicanus]|nr:hypothetical protein M0802_004189 [Mischocyttarus mexicanus]
MSKRRSCTMIVSQILFTGLLLTLIESGTGLKCYSCSSLDDANCLNNPSNTVECSAPTPTPTPTTTPTPTPTPTTTTNSTTNSTTEPTDKPTDKPTDAPTDEPTDEPTDAPIEEKKFNLDHLMFNDWNSEFASSENKTYSCHMAHITLINGTSGVIRGCIEQDTFTCNNVSIPIKDCSVEYCGTDKCNSSSMEKMGIISLLLPLITVLLRIR